MSPLPHLGLHAPTPTIWKKTLLVNIGQQKTCPPLSPLCYQLLQQSVQLNRERMPWCELVTSPQARLRAMQTDVYLHNLKQKFQRLVWLQWFTRTRVSKDSSTWTALKATLNCHLQALRMVMLDLAENVACKQADFSDWIPREWSWTEKTGKLSTLTSEASLPGFALCRIIDL